MKYTVSEVLQYVDENDVKFVRLAYCDIFGVQKNISIMSDKLKSAFEKGISIDGYAAAGFDTGKQSDLLLIPDPSTLCILPWRPTHGGVVGFFCNVRYPNGDVFECDSRTILENAVNKLKSYHLEASFGTKSEFYLFKLDENGKATHIPYDDAGYMDIAPLDKGENVRREICLTLEEMDISPAMSYHEAGPGQHEIVFNRAPAVTAAENFLTFKRVVKTVAAGNGLHATFMPKPLAGKTGNGLHIKLSLKCGGMNWFDDSNLRDSKEARSFIAGILNRAKEISVFLNPLTNSYKRLGEYEAPKYISWSHQSRSQLIRIPSGGNSGNKIEVRSADASCNPYVAFALILYAGIDGIERELELQEESHKNLFTADNEYLKQFDILPENLNAAIEYAKNSNFLKKCLPEFYLNEYLRIKTEECIECRNSTDEHSFEMDKYFLNV